MKDYHHSFPSFRCIVHQQSKQGNRICGDSYYVDEQGDYFVVSIADGLGSGEEAHHAARHATSLIEQLHPLPSPEIIQEVNRQMAGTRGVVLAVVKFYPGEARVEYSGIGNITFVLYPSSGKRIRPLNVPGYLDGRNVRTREEFMSYRPGDRFIMYSDGVAANQQWERVIREMTTPEEGFKQIKQYWQTHNDDLTFIVGC